MKFAAFVTGALLLTACTQGPGPLPAPPAGPATQFLREGPDSHSQVLYTVNNSANSVTEYLAKATGNVSPRATIAGSSTQLNTPINIAVAAGKIYVTNLTANLLTKYGASSNGNVAPTAAITCGGLNFPDGVALDSTGNIFVANLQGNSISIFKPRANGCVKRANHIAGTKTMLSRPSGLLISGSTLFASNINAHSITEYAVSARGNVSPTAEIEIGRAHV